MATRKVNKDTTKSVFHDLGLADADDLFLRAELMRKIGAIIERQKLTQVDVAKLIGMDQPRVSALIHGKLSKFSTERLLKALNDMGHDIEIRIKPATKQKGVTRVTTGIGSRVSKAA